MNEEELKKGCGITLETWSWGNNYFVKEEDLDNDFCGEECRNPHNKSRLGKVQYCDVCQAKLEQHRQTKAECRIEELEFLKNVHIQLWYYFENGELKILQRELENRIKELQKADEMFKEEEKQDENS